MTNTNLTNRTPGRLYSLDALRGFDMFWIMGAEEIVHSLFKATKLPFFEAFSEQLTHPAWDGFHMYDCIFPLFLFIAGVASPYSVGREIEKGHSKGSIFLKIAKRALILILLGLVVNNGLVIRPISEIRFGSVLGRIGIAYMFANFIYLITKKQITRVICFFSLVVGYYLLLKFNAAPGFPKGDLTQAGNFASYLDRLIMPGKLYLGNHDPEGLISTIPAIGTGLLGIIVGNYLKNSIDNGSKKSLILFSAGLLFIVIAKIWNIDFPINKNLWSSSFTMLVGGISMIFLSVFYYIIDVKGYRYWAFFFNVIGMNSILIYISGHFINWDYTTNGLFHWVGQLLGEPYNAVAFSALYVFVQWQFLYFMYKQKVFLKV
jgi:predicted acyltransferase